ncbi:glycosyltransferase family 4 protein [Flavobacterium zepuense]|uniref:Glycosyltransferase family 4 protein n=1 Tax=Flavobacterium zepuense TaxID=2593302 RepID=A0A552UVC1_9FLAO|nr:glycosyltransferase family 4 protein [Flavobacterium zepuense]TRW22147.1 glycosyltransferase family 4 protein [Flavobacterium zepuense]
MKVLFQSRANLYTAPGGDLVQMEKTKKYLEKEGVIVDISLEPEPDLTGYDLVHLFNLMEPQDIYIQLKNAQKQNKKVVLSTIYGLYTEFERKARGGLFQYVANVLSPYQIGYLKTIIKYVAEGRMHKGVYKMLFKGYYGMMKEIVDNTSVFLPNSDSEMLRVAKEFKLKGYNYFNVPNAIDKEVFTDDTTVLDNEFSQYKDCILCAARIEGRKSTLTLVQAVKDSPYQLVLVGKESANQKKYVEQVHAAAGSNVHFLGIMPHEQLKKLYKAAKVHALVSWMETPGLSSLEAAAMGCNIVVTKKGDTEDYFKDYAYYCEPDNVASIRKAIDEAYAAPFNPELKERILENYIWEKTASQTIKGYELALR